tara:strand:- start:6472 stop:7095 length:624 start_codon:yes stop_codon:yes gene_type:complete
MSNIEDYCIKYSEKESQTVSELKKFTFQSEEAPQMISGKIVGNLLMMLIKTGNYKKILEVGMFTGYSALNMAEILPKDGELHTCEVMDRHIKTANKFFNRSKHGKKIFIHKGDACKTLEQFETKSFDFIFIDADKNNYINYYKKCIHLLKPGGIIVLDNMFWGGSVLKPNDEQSITLNNLANIINEDERIINIMLPVRDGLMVCLKK